MRRKLEIVRSLIHDPKVLFLDEPTAGLDPPSRRSLWGYLDTVRRERGTTIFLTTHYLEEAEQADRICVIDDGRVVAYGTPAAIKAELVDEYVLVDADDRRGARWPSSPGWASPTPAPARSGSRSTGGGRTRSCGRSRRR